MTFEEIREGAREALMPTYGRFNVAIESGRGATLTDSEGRQYIDFGSGIGVNSLGSADPDWVAAVQKQAATLAHCSNLYYQSVSTALADELCAATGMGRVFFANSGAEANECAIKLARKHGLETRGEGRTTIVTLKNSFHGRTLTTLSATGQDAFHRHFFPFPEGFVHAEAGNFEDLLDKADDTVCAVMLECIQGEGGVIPLPAEYLRAVRKLCTERGWLMIIDEVQTGAGRTGRFFAYEHAGIVPDVVTLAKGLGGGLPIGACLCADALGNVLSAGTHGSTFGGNPIVCAGARVVLRKLTASGFLDEVTAKGNYLRERIAAMPNVTEVRGQGLMLGIVPETGDARALAEQCLNGGLLILTAKTLLRLLPPLTITRQEMDKGLSVLEAVLKGV